jgi:ankyrin repeat protein
MEQVYAQEMFRSFMWAVAAKLEVPISGETSANALSDTVAWQSFRLENSTLLKIVQTIQQAGLASVEDAWTLIIPPLSFKARLPQRDIIITQVRERAREHESNCDWEKVEQIYVGLWNICCNFGSDDSAYCTAAAVIAQVLIYLSGTLKIYKDQKRVGDEITQLESSKNSLANIFHNSLGVRVRQGLMKVVGTLQERFESCKYLQNEDPDHLINADTLNLPQFVKQAQNLADVRKYESMEWAVKEWVNKNKLKKSSDIFGWTLLHYGANMGVGMEHLTSVVESTKARDMIDWTPLHYAAARGNDLAISSLLQRGASMDAQGRDGIAPLHCAAKEGNSKAVDLLLQAGANEAIRDNLRNTPLHWGAWSGNNMITTALLNKGAYGGARDNYGRTPLHLAAMAQNVDVVKTFLKRGPEHALAQDRNGNTALHLAVEYGNKEVVQAFVLKETEELKSLRTVQNNKGDTALHSAARLSHGEAVRMLVKDAKFGVGSKNMFELTALHIASIIGDDATIEVLEELNANAAATDSHGNTGLHFAVFFANVKAVKRHVRNLGAKKDQENGRGYTALHLAEAM